jgi:hypothetical protein
MSALVPIVSSCAPENTAIEREPAPPIAATQTAMAEPQGGVVATPKPDTESAKETVSAAPIDEAPPVMNQPKPAAKEWNDAAEIAVANKRCEARRLGDFVRLKCGPETTLIQQLVGEPRGLAFGCWDSSSQPSCVVFPVRRGDKRIFQFDALFTSGGWEGGASLAQEAMASIWWPKDASEPKISID